MPIDIVGIIGYTMLITFPIVSIGFAEVITMKLIFTSLLRQNFRFGRM